MQEHDALAAAVLAKATIIYRNLDTNFIGRDEYIRVLLLGLLTGQNVPVLGPPGTAKSEVISDFFARIKAVFTATHGGRDWSSTHSQEPTGTMSELVAIDDVFEAKSNDCSAWTNLLDQRVFCQGSAQLHFVAATSDQISFDPDHARLLDRFPLRVFVDGLDDERLDLLLDASPPLGRNRAAAQAESDVTRLDLRTDVYALLDAVNEAPALPLPVDFNAMILDHVRFANGLNLASEASPLPKVVQTQSREVYCSNVITNRGIVAFSGMLRVIALLHGRGSTPCALDVFPLTYMSWHTAAQRKVVAARMLDKLHDALPALVENNGADWVYNAIRTHLFIPDAVKAMLYSQILANMAQSGLVDAVVDLLRIPDVDPSHKSSLLLQVAMDGQHHSLLSMLRLDGRIDTSALDQHEEEEARQLAVRDEETQNEGTSGCESEDEARELAFPTGDDVDQAVGGESSGTIAAGEEDAQQAVAKVEEKEQVPPVVVGEVETREGEKRVEKQEQDAAEERAPELAEKMLDGTRPPDLPALQRLSTVASQRDDLITLSAAKVFHGRHVGEDDWIIPMSDPTSLMGEVLRVRVCWLNISTTALLVPNGSWELRVRLKSPSYRLPKINVEVTIQAPVIGPKNQLGWESRTICVDDIQLPPTDDQYVQWRVPVEPVQIESALGFSKLSLRLM